MPGPFEATGAIKQPTAYGALGMGARQMTGEWTQRSPYRDAAVPYLYSKFYSASRFDSIIDGLNREISMDLTDIRRPGSSPYNSRANFPAVMSYMGWKYVQTRIPGQGEQIRVMMDGADGNIRDITAPPGGPAFGNNFVWLAKAAGAGAARGLGVGNEFFLGDNVDLKKFMQPASTWLPSTNFAPGTLVTTVTAASGTSGPGSLFMALGGLDMFISATSSDGTFIYVYIRPSSIPDVFPNLNGVEVSFGGCTLATSLNGNTYPVTVLSSTLGILRVAQAQTPYTKATDTGAGTTGNGVSGLSQPAFSGTEFAVTADGGQQWKTYANQVQNWTPAGPTSAPGVSPANGSRFWQQTTSIPNFYAILDSNQNVELAFSMGGGGGPSTTGFFYPVWGGFVAFSGTLTSVSDGQVIWNNYGPVSTWAASTQFGSATSGTGKSPYFVILDSNGNWQLFQSGTATGGSAPAWATSIGTTTTDGGATWICLGPGAVLTTANISYAFTLHGIDGTVTTSSPLFTVQGPIVGKSQLPTDAPLAYLTITGGFIQDPQLDQIWIGRTAQGKAIVVLEDQIPIDTFYAGSAFTYSEYGITDTSTNGTGALNAEIPLPVSKQGDPPPTGFLPFCFYLQRIWGVVNNQLVYSGGPDTVTGNGNTAFPPLNTIPFIGAPIRAVPITLQNGALLVYTTSGMWVVFGTGTTTNPFYATPYYQKANLAAFNTQDVWGNQIYMMEANGRVSSLAIEYPFNPQTGYTEIGFPIGDQFLKATTGGFNASIFNPASCSLSWNIQDTKESAMYVANQAGQWFRMSLAAPPESGIIWSPIASIQGGASCIQAIETAPGLSNLLIGPPSGTPGPILMRDRTKSQDNGVSYPAWDVKGVTLLCSTGQVSELAGIATKSAATGARPQVGFLMNEIKATTATPFTILQPTAQDPAILPPSQTAYSDFYSTEQNGAIPKGDCVSLKFDYGTQNFPDELLDFQIYGTKDDIRIAPTAAG